MAVFKNDQEKEKFVRSFLNEKIKIGELRDEKITNGNLGCYLSHDHGLLEYVALGANESNVFLRFWEYEDREKRKEKIAKRRSFLEDYYEKIQQDLGPEVKYASFQKVNHYICSEDNSRKGFCVYYPDRKSVDELNQDINRLYKVYCYMKNIIDENLLLKKIQTVMGTQGSDRLEYIKLGKDFLQYKPVNANSIDWRDSACHYEFREDGKGNLQICFHCESKFSNQSEFKKLVQKEPFEFYFLGNKTTIEYKRISLASENLINDAVKSMLEFEKQYGQKILELIQKSKGEIPSENSNNAEENMSASEINEKEIALNTILYGPPGTGKTFNTLTYAVAICNDENVEEVKGKMQKDYKSVKEDYDNLKKNGRIEFVTFHQSYGYEDFIEGIRPIVDDESSGLKYEKYQGVFKKFCEKAENDEKQNYVFIIDEINRGNISKIFGELITLIEPSKRLGEKESMKVTLPCSGDEFGVPNNVYILGTMNTADRSIAMMDSALRRRFNFVEMMPDTSVLKNYKGNDIGVDICKMLETINERIEYLYDREHTIGHAFFIGVDSLKKLSSVFKNKVIPLLQEYFYDDYEKIRIVLGDDEKEEKYQFITRARPREGLFKKSNDAEYLNTEKYIYRINQEAEDFDEPDYYKGII